MSVAAIVLTGGQSRRMGTDKASLVVNGRSLAAHVEAVASAAGVDTIVFAGSADLPDPASASGPQGPLAGIVAGWQRLCATLEAPPDPVVVLSVDLPGLTPEVVSELISRSTESETGAIAHDGERLQPLVAAYRPVAMQHLVEAFESGQRSVRKVFGAWDLVTVHFASQAVLDADTPADLADFDVDWPQESGRGRGPH